MAVERGSSAKRGYGYRWQQERKRFLTQPENVLCRMCSDRGLVVVATVVDHIKPHRGDKKLFWDRKNWQPLCKPCHDSEKQSMEKGGSSRATFTNGRVDW